MKKITLLYLTVGLLALGAPALLAQDTNQAPGTTHPAGEHRHGNQEFLRAIGLTPSELKGLSKEDRRAKIQSAAEATETTLEQKQAAGTITDQEKTDLALIQKRLEHSKKAAAQ
jgi:hypothetical protein